MANQEYLDLLKQGSSDWNAWRVQHWELRPDLSKADLSKADLTGADLSQADFSGANLSGANLSGANLGEINLSEVNLSAANLSRVDLSGKDLSGKDLSEANLSEANLGGTDLTEAILYKAILRQANLSETTLSEADLREADLSKAILRGARLIRTDLEGANLVGCSIYGISAWNVHLKDTKQSSLIITLPNEPEITVDNLDVAQFIYLLLNNENIRHVIDTITYKVVLILGRFTYERKQVLEALRDELRKRNDLPVLFDFEKPASRDITETISTLAHMARFVIADITDAKSIPQELQAIVPNLPSVPVQPLILISQHEYSMFEHFTRFPWVLPVYRYLDEVSLLQSLKEKVIAPAEQKAKELEKR